MASLANKTALGTGASRGIGRATAAALAKMGAHLIVHYGRSAAEADALVAGIRAAGGSADAARADLSMPEGAAALALADQVTPGQLAQGLLFPPQSNILETEIKVAARVAQMVFESKLACVARPDDCEAFIRRHVYKPEYRDLV